MCEGLSWNKVQEFFASVEEAHPWLGIGMWVLDWMPLHWSWLASLHSWILCLIFRASSSSAFPHLTNNNEGAGNRSKVSPSRNSGKHQEVSILNTKKPPAFFRESFLFHYARFTGVVFLSWELSDELGKLPKGMASPGRLRAHPAKRSVKWVPFGTISSAGSIPYGSFQKVVQSKSILWTNSFIAFIDRVERGVSLWYSVLIA